MEHIPVDLPSWLQAFASVAAIVLSVAALMRSSKAEKISKKIGTLAGKLSSLRAMVQQIEQVKLENLASPKDDKNKRALIVASKAQSYEAMLNTYHDFLPDDDVSRLRETVKEFREQSDRAVAATNADARSEYATRYINLMADFVVAMETLPQKQLEKVAKAYSALVR